MTIHDDEGTTDPFASLREELEDEARERIEAEDDAETDLPWEAYETDEDAPPGPAEDFERPEHDLDFWSYCHSCGEYHQTEEPSRELTERERNRFLRTGQLPPGVRFVLAPLPVTYGTPDREYWTWAMPGNDDGHRHPDHVTGHTHDGGRVHPGECPFCDGEPFEDLAEAVREGTIEVPVYCTASMSEEDPVHHPEGYDMTPPCHWCDEKSPTRLCECHQGKETPGSPEALEHAETWRRLRALKRATSVES